MADSRDSIYSEDLASVYDAWFGDWLNTAPAVDRLAALGRAGPVLKLGIGTGRVAIPLRERGIDVQGIDGSEAMVARLRARPGGERIPVTLGDFSEVGVDGAFSLVYVTAGSFFELPTQEAQLRCFRNVARRLAPGGVFAFDGLVPATALLAGNEPMKVIPGQPGRLVVRLREVDPFEQRYTSHYVVMAEGGMRLVSVRFRYASPAELDLMAELAGLRLRERSRNWQGEQFTAASTQQVCLYEQAPASAAPQ